MTNKLRQYFPSIRTREEVMTEIASKQDLRELFDSWNEEQQTEFLDFCTGARGVKMLYDFMIKEILNPETTPERLNELLSLLLEKKVRIVSVLPNDTTRIADESSLVITDIVVELEDGSLANVEVQKIGYYFPGQRAACYSSDLLLRQYKRVRGIKGKTFSYKDIKTVYTIILFEKSTKEFHAHPGQYLHRSEQKFDTGLQLELLQKYICIPLDIFKEIKQNESISNRLEAWLAFLCMDDPETIVSIINQYPGFGAMYEQMCDICRNIEGVMRMFSKELQELDRNTVQYMIDVMQDEINEQKRDLQKKDEEMKENKQQMEKTIQQKDEELEKNRQQMENMEASLQKALDKIAELGGEL